jgi:hypothetical protein
MSAPGEKAVMVVLEREAIEHTESYDKKKDRKAAGGTGTRIVKEGQMHATCAATHSPADVSTYQPLAHQPDLASILTEGMGVG